MSDTFLFDLQNTGRMKYSKGDKLEPELIWKTQLPSFPEYGAESNCIIDDDGNLYFGCHNGVFYSLDITGKIRWTFFTGGKIYSSPTFIHDDGVVVGSGSGYLYCFSRCGNLKWTYRITHKKDIKSQYSIVDLSYRITRSIYSKVRETIMNYIHTDGYYSKNINEKTIAIWASPKVLDSNTILLSGSGIGLHAVNAFNGQKKWSYNLGSPSYHIAGPVIDSENNIYIPSKTRYLHCIDEEGTIKWVHDSKSNYHAWSTPTIDEEKRLLFYSRSLGEKKAIIYALNFEGDLIWSVKINAAVRGSASISYLDYILIGDFKGRLLFINKNNGSIIREVSLTKAERGLWTTPSIDKKGNIYISVKETRYSGLIYCLDSEGNILWNYKTGKALSTPVLDGNGRLYFGNWNGEYICLQT